jgi:hypothetical protein
MQQRGNKRGRVHAKLGKDLGDRQRVRDVGLTALAQLTTVHTVRDRVGTAEQLPIAVAMDAPVRPDHPLHRIREMSGAEGRFPHAVCKFLDVP